ncbi:MAG: 3'(2'),5'-bisphosphate nucleotidase [Deltaproteobacteria bacterium]|nr:3'(2'),5'-bisphosphate nucleotidase [Deltaproteobacteria bacterium]
MTQPDFHSERDLAVSAVIEAAVICAAVQAEISSEVLEKKDRSPVTVADFGSQAVICRLLAERFPDDPVIAEEGSTELREGAGASLLPRVVDHLSRVVPGCSADDVCAWIDHGGVTEYSERFWTLDPIDGTKGFLRRQQFAISLGLIVRGELTVAAVGCPKLGLGDEQGVVFSAVRGQGATQQPLGRAGEPQSIAVSGESEPANIRFCESVERGHSSHDDAARIAERLGIVAAPVRLDSQTKYAVVARGDAEAYLRLPKSAEYQEKIWDHAGGALVVVEAGGRVSDIRGNPLDFTRGRTLERNRGVIVSNGRVHDAILGAISELEIGY